MQHLLRAEDMFRTLLPEQESRLAAIKKRCTVVTDHTPEHHKTELAKKLQAQGYDLDELDKDNPYN